LSFFTDPTSTTLSNNYTVLPQTKVSVIGSPASTVNTSTGVITLPNRPCILSGCLQYYLNSTASFVDFQWYDVTNSQFIGNKARLKGRDVVTYLGTYTLSTDEEANAVAQNIDVKMVVVTTSDTSAVLEDTTNPFIAYAGFSRLAVYEF
jgi:hypothetical protein